VQQYVVPLYFSSFTFDAGTLFLFSQSPPKPADGLLQHTRAQSAYLQEYVVPHRPGYVNIDVAKRLASCYGDQARLVTKIAGDNNLGHRLVPWHNIIEAEVVYAARHEMCLSAEDFLARRCRLAFLDVKAARAALPRVVQLLGDELGWSRWTGRRRRELDAAHAFLDTFDALT
jgi:glycerol-3-phosphate dehydrogenase